MSENAPELLENKLSDKDNSYVVFLLMSFVLPLFIP